MRDVSNELRLTRHMAEILAESFSSPLRSTVGRPLPQSSVNGVIPRKLRHLQRCRRRSDCDASSRRSVIARLPLAVDGTSLLSPSEMRTRKYSRTGRPGSSCRRLALNATSEGRRKNQFPAVGPQISFGIFGSNVGAGWSGIPGGSGPYRYNEYTSETALYDVAKNDLIWTGTVRTREPKDVQTAIKSYVQTVTKALAEQNLLPKR